MANSRAIRYRWQKARDKVLTGNICPTCKQGKLVQKEGTWSWDFPVYGVLKVEDAIWYVCDRCQDEVFPPALDEQIDRAMTDVDPVSQSETRTAKEAAKRRERARKQREREDPARAEELRRRARDWYHERKRLEGRA